MTRPSLQQKITEQLHVVSGDVEQDIRILVIYGLGGSGKSQLALNFVRTYRGDYTAVFWIEAGQKETIERDYLSMYRLLFGDVSARSKSPHGRRGGDDGQELVSRQERTLIGDP